MTTTATLPSLAREAVLYTLPLYEMARMRAANCPRRDGLGKFAGATPESTLRWINHFVHTRQLLGPQHRQVVSPNNDTLYTNAWLDLSQSPLLLTVPASGERYYVLGLLDFYTNPFGYIGTRTTGNDSGTYLLHGTNWSGDAPAGVTPLACPTDAVWLMGRIMIAGVHDLPAAHAFQDAFKLVRPDGSNAHRPFDVGMQPNDQVGDPRKYVDVVARALRENPPPAAQAAMVTRFAAVGIGANANAAQLPVAQLTALRAAIASALDETAAPRPSALNGGWFLPAEVQDSYGEDYFARAQVARNYIGVLGIKEAMYIMADCDSSGAPLDGTHAYALHFPADRLPQVGAFWSVTLYDKADCMLVDNELNRYSLGDRSPALRYDADGGLRVFFSAQAPRDRKNHGNWLPAPRAPFYLVLRLYMPKAAHLDKTFKYPSINLVSKE